MVNLVIELRLMSLMHVLKTTMDVNMIVITRHRAHFARVAMDIHFRMMESHAKMWMNVRLRCLAVSTLA